MFKGRNSEYVPRDKKLERDNSCMMTMTKVFVPSVVEELYRVETECVHSSDKAVHHTNDIALILNQQRLDRMTLAGFSEYLNQTQQTDDALSAIRSKLTDKQLFDFVKSRYVQSPCELKAWYSYLQGQEQSLIDAHNVSVLQQVAQNKAAAAAPAPASAASD